ncbi:NAD(P)/FAD-dependent oxidoreductase [Streptomyces phaeochromogenes]|uniref:NAD(P)/FAD-dependent oxidoreductase n=1 Tax=Streptomyces phaeochromogenes TaxID=1923 RepID=UPI002DD8AF8E|nr:FAD-dependent oxidoreductase [Streptomyces phaeochromogenes]WRZ34564.1 FAD-dependent oxidoreductase [Streptomyces phaeochromogenes]
MSTPRRIVVVGAGLAGVSTCDALRAGGFDGDLLLLSAEDGLPYDRPPLSKDVLLGKARYEDLLLRPAAWYADNAVELRTGAVVTALRPAESAVELADGLRISADRVVLATGGTPRALPVEGGDDRAVHTLRTWDDALRLGERLLPGARVAVIGAGLIGAETAAAAAALGCRVTLIDPVPVPLAAAVGTDIARALHHRHAEAGIRLVTGGVERIERRTTADEVLVHTTGSDAPLAADTVVVGIGIRPSTALAEAAGLHTGNGVVVDDRQRTSHPRVLAVGDLARRDGHSLRHEHWDAAQRDGQVAAAGLLGAAPPAGQATWFWSDRHGSRLEAVGTMADAERTVLRGAPDRGPFTAFGLRGEHLVAAAAIDRGRDIRTARRIIDRAAPVDAARLADETADLRALLRV